MDHRGTHLIVDLYGCRKAPGGGGEAVLRSVARLAGLNIVEGVSHAFPGGGDTAILLLSQSHCSVHSWPEVGYVAFDLYSCKVMEAGLAGAVVDLLRERYGAEQTIVRTLKRGHVAVPEKV